MANLLSFNFCLNTDVYFGVGVRNKLFEKIQANNYEYIGLILDHNIINNPFVRDLINKLHTETKLLKIGYCRISEPTYISLEELRDGFIDERLQVVIGLGGGSAIDMAKAMAVLINNTRPAIFYRGFDKMTKPVLPVIAIPTTAGTGSEITPNASFIDSVEKKKMGINGESMRPSLAFLDPELTLSCPKLPTISAGVDSIVHATEAFVAKKTNPIAQFFAREGCQRVLAALPELTDSLHDIQLRSEVMYGAFMSSVALMHSGTGPAAAMSYPLGVHYGVPHGIGGALFLPHVVELNVTRGFNGYGGLIDGFNVDRFDNNLLGAQKYLETLKAAWGRLNIIESLESYEIDSDLFVSETMVLIGALEQNPVLFESDEILHIIRALGVD